MNTKLRLKLFGVGNAGIQVLEHFAADGAPPFLMAAINTDSQSLGASSAVEKVQLEKSMLRELMNGAKAGGQSVLPEACLNRFKELCAETDVLLVAAGLGGSAGTFITPCIARAAHESGALVLAFLTTPFDCEGSRRRELALTGLEELKAICDGVICLPNQKILSLTDDKTSVVETFRLAGSMLADAIRGVVRLLTHAGLIELDFSDLEPLWRHKHSESAFAVAEASGQNRSREVVEKLLAHPLLEGGQALAEAEAVLVSLIGGPELTMSEVNRVMEQLNRHCERAQVVMGAALEEAFRDRLAVIVLASRRTATHGEAPEPRASNKPEELTAQLLDNQSNSRPGSRFVPPPPDLSPEKVEQLLGRRSAAARARRTASKLRQTQLPLDIVSKGRFDKSEPTIHKGEDLDVPTYIRRGISLN